LVYFSHFGIFWTKKNLATLLSTAVSIQDWGFFMSKQVKEVFCGDRFWEQKKLGAVFQ
jgi:hypothetical protein